MSDRSKTSIDAVLAAADEEVLELEPELELVPELLRAGEDAAEDRARAVRPLLALDGDVAGEPREVRLPRHGRERVEVGHRRDVGIARRLADLARGEPGEARALGDEAVQPRGRDQLRARPAVQVDELREVELDPPFVADPTDLLQRRHLLRPHASSSRE